MFSSFADAVLGFFETILTFFHDIFVPVFGQHSWGWAIIALTVLVRIAMLPLAVKQIRSMRAMQAIQPELKELQKKYKVDRSLMRKDPEQYRAKRQQMNDAMMELYRREKVNPAASCLPLLAQAPVFIALFWTLREFTTLANQPFYFFTSFGSEDAAASGLGMLVNNAGWPGWLLIVVMSGSMFLMQKQMMARNAAKDSSGDNPMAQQQKIMLYVMPLFLAVISFNFPLGILLYWVTTNLWQVAQQGIMAREVQHEATAKTSSKGVGLLGRLLPGTDRAGAPPETDQAERPRSPGASSGRPAPTSADDAAAKGGAAKGGKTKGGTAKGGKTKGGTAKGGKAKAGTSKDDAAEGGKAKGAHSGSDNSAGRPGENGSGPDEAAKSAEEPGSGADATSGPDRKATNGDGTPEASGSGDPHAGQPTSGPTKAAKPDHLPRRGGRRGNS